MKTLPISDCQLPIGSNVRRTLVCRALDVDFAVVRTDPHQSYDNGVMAFTVTQRTQEFAVRLALGAQRSRVIKLVLREGSLLAGIGSLIGLAGAYLTGRALQTTLYGVEALDLSAFLAVAVVLLCTALLTSLVPALRASRVDPIEALRSE